MARQSKEGLRAYLIASAMSSSHQPRCPYSQGTWEVKKQAKLTFLSHIWLCCDFFSISCDSWFFSTFTFCHVTVSFIAYSPILRIRKRCCVRFPITNSVSGILECFTWNFPLRHFIKVVKKWERNLSIVRYSIRIEHWQWSVYRMEYWAFSALKLESCKIPIFGNSWV